MEKIEFIITKLKPLMIALEIGIVDVYFEITTFDENVVIKYKNGEYLRKCVTADSLSALVSDTLKNL